MVHVKRYSQSVDDSFVCKGRGHGSLHWVEHPDSDRDQG